MRKLSIICLLFSLIIINIESIHAKHQITPESIMQHIEVLAHDSLEGRKVGEPGELKAAEYIRSEFKKFGLESKNLDDYFQYYDFIKEIKFTENNLLTIEGIELTLYEDYIPLKQSASMEFSFSGTDFEHVGYGIKTGDDSMDYNDYYGKEVKGKAVFIQKFSPPQDEYPHTDFSKHELLVDKINMAIKHEVSAIFFRTPEGHDDTLIDRGVTNVHQKDIPIIFIKQSAFEKTKLVSNRKPDYAGRVDIVKVRDTAQNVIGFLQGETDTTVIIGAHYDHLGWGGPSSLNTGEPAIHNGADDNASGVAAMLELAKYYATADEKLHYSMMFIAFSGEEAGLLGANNFAKNMTIDSSKIRMMINMDMIGRMKDQDNGLAILGVGTTKAFKPFFDSLDFLDMKLSLKESGTGPSDHTIFYNRKIPALHLFTGAHYDYHKPSDDANKIDSEGIVKVTKLVDTLVKYLDNIVEPLVFTKTKDSSEGKRSRKYSVSLGVMPDYVAEVQGLKIDGIMSDRPAEKAGLLEGDIVTKMGDVEVNDIYDYMGALSKFRKGDTIMVIVNRNGEMLEFSVTF